MTAGKSKSSISMYLCDNCKRYFSVWRRTKKKQICIQCRKTTLWVEYPLEMYINLNDNRLCEDPKHQNSMKMLKQSSTHRKLINIL